MPFPHPFPIDQSSIRETRQNQNGHQQWMKHSSKLKIWYHRKYSSLIQIGHHCFVYIPNAWDKQLGAAISQNNKTIAFFSQRLSKLQRNYTTTDLSIVECLKQFRNILFGYEIHVYSDHKNLVYKATLSESQRVMRWCLLLEEFGLHIHHIAGVDNIVANTMSCMKSSNIGEDENESSK